MFHVDVTPPPRKSETPEPIFKKLERCNDLPDTTPCAKFQGPDFRKILWRIYDDANFQKILWHFMILSYDRVVITSLWS